MLTKIYTLFFLFSLTSYNLIGQQKAVFILLDGIPADLIEKVATPTLDKIAHQGGYTRAYVGGEKDGYSETPTVSAPGYMNLITGTWANKHRVRDNKVEDPNYHYWNIFRVLKNVNPTLQTALFSTWEDNRTKLIGEGKPAAGGELLDYWFDGFENDTLRFPHRSDRKFIFDIDEHVSTETAHYITEKGPDLSWVYLEFTDDIGHKFGDSPQMEDAIKKADIQVKRIWEAIEKRQKQHGEDWMIVITTDHGRNQENGKSHGKQSERERTTWIITNNRLVNKRFDHKPAIVDIMPSILRHMNLEIPDAIHEEIDGTAFIGDVSIENVKVKAGNSQIEIKWDTIIEKGNLDIYMSPTNNFSEGGKDHYDKIATVPVKDKHFIMPNSKKGSFYKILIKAPHNWINRWWVED